MATTTCPKCEGHSFEVATVNPVGEQRLISVLQCAACGTPIVSLDSQATIQRLQAQIAGIDAGLTRIAKALSEI